MTTRQQIVDCARTWLGTPFRHQGRLKGIGGDCAGLVVGVAHELGLSDFDSKDYGRSPHSGQMKDILDREMIAIPVDSALPGDVLFFAFEGDPQHVAIVTSIGIIHNYSMVKKCVEHSLDATWIKRIRGAYRFRGIE